MAPYTRISGDSHLEVANERWTHRVDPAYRDRAPRTVKLNTGADATQLEDMTPTQNPMDLYPPPSQVELSQMATSVIFSAPLPQGRKGRFHGSASIAGDLGNRTSRMVRSRVPSTAHSRRVKGGGSM